MSNTKSHGGISFIGALFITFLVLKLTKVIDWSWWWITAPVWALPALFAVLLLVLFVVAAVREREAED